MINIIKNDPTIERLSLFIPVRSFLLILLTLCFLQQSMYPSVSSILWTVTCALIFFKLELLLPSFEVFLDLLLIFNTLTTCPSIYATQEKLNFWSNFLKSLQVNKSWSLELIYWVFGGKIRNRRKIFLRREMNKK